MAPHYGQLAARLARDGAPGSWRGARCVPVPRKPRRPLSMQNSRGVACGDALGKIYATIIRAKLTPALKQQAGEWQMGAVPGGSVDLLSHA